ncbi:hypothetical protein, partial [Salmonella enterica]|uniref:hypothetical protein n=1 Tax=Salmonella enterica TaxID=28901 RepID=UPI00398C7B91
MKGGRGGGKESGTETGGDEGCQGRRGIHLFGGREANPEIGEQGHAFPAGVQRQQVSGKDQTERAGDKEVGIS